MEQRYSGQPQYLQQLAQELGERMEIKGIETRRIDSTTALNLQRHFEGD